MTANAYANEADALERSRPKHPAEFPEAAEFRVKLGDRLKAMEAERDKLRELEAEVIDQRERMEDACDSVRDAIDRLSEFV